MDIDTLIQNVATDPEARRQLTALGVEAVPQLLEHIDDLHVRLVLRDIGEPAVALLADALEGDPRRRKGILWTLGEMTAKSRVINETLLAWLDRQELTFRQRLELVQALGKRKETRAFDHLATLLDEVDNRDVVLVLQALGWMGDGRAAPLLAIYLRSENTLLRRAAVNAMRWLEASAAVEPLLDVLVIEPEALIRNEAARALGELGDPRAVPLIETHADSDDPMVREALERLRE